ncbi:MAG TPA: protein-disulfide reductase DsbD family protein [Ferruginibacter sp.]|jgi:thiol:disulfide interchange protein DsbD|nr:hypothetical protein [Bacteroidota bacterium]MCC6691808.1 hypothetical protein [Chitinophagaceae bacterium]HMT96877.1 protein-disulfide reductase DsbD family protein [Ferruginibacter sp.]MBS1925544.1 hypothetical protein [Bacteroidota bacterium]HMU25068.1 protein-disulfide reductase DsbD family protein [Ferruginibacter sp.]
MKKVLLTLVISTGIFAMAFAQIENPVTWSYSAKKVADKVYELQMTATLSPGWHLYSQNAGEALSDPTSFVFANNPLFKLENKVKETGKLISEYDPTMKGVLKFYKDKVTFTQRVKMKSTAPTVAKGTVTYIVCNDRKCLPPKDVDFSIKLGGK